MRGAAGQVAIDHFANEQRGLGVAYFQRRQQRRSRGLPWYGAGPIRLAGTEPDQRIAVKGFYHGQKCIRARKSVCLVIPLDGRPRQHLLMTE